MKNIIKLKTVICYLNDQGKVLCVRNRFTGRFMKRLFGINALAASQRMYNDFMNRSDDVCFSSSDFQFDIVSLVGNSVISYLDCYVGDSENSYKIRVDHINKTFEPIMYNGKAI